MPRPRLLAAALAAVLLLLLPAAAQGASRFVIRGAGYGHGVGLSQYGALGFAQRGAGYQQILAHYYTGTALGALQDDRVVRVLLPAPRRTFTGATRAGGRRVRPEVTYGVRGRADGGVDLLSPKGRRLATAPAPLRVTGRAPVTLAGGGSYRGALLFHPTGEVVNAVRLEDYLRGVVPRESPASWPIEALKAQAVAARTYAITTGKGAPTWDHYADERSQVYGGVGSETPSTDAAIAQTRGQVVTHQGRPVVTYFFSTSGGRTEDVEHVFGGAPQAHLRSVADPHDDVSPRHRWGPIELTFTAASRKLKGLVKGGFRGIEVVRRGSSPRVIEADVIGTRGRTRVRGSVLRARLGLFDTWAFFTSLTAEEAPAVKVPDADAPAAGGGAQPPAEGLDPAGRMQAMPSRVAPRRTASAVTGRVLGPGKPVRVELERRVDGRWLAAGSTRTGADGRYRLAARAAGRYRVRATGVTGPAVRVGLGGSTTR